MGHKLRTASPCQLLTLYHLRAPERTIPLTVLVNPGESNQEFGTFPDISAAPSLGGELPTFKLLQPWAMRFIFIGLSLFSCYFVQQPQTIKQPILPRSALQGKIFH